MAKGTFFQGKNSNGKSSRKVYDLAVFTVTQKREDGEVVSIGAWGEHTLWLKVSQADFNTCLALSVGQTINDMLICQCSHGGVQTSLVKSYVNITRSQ